MVAPGARKTGTISRMIVRARGGDEDAYTCLWNYYRAKVVAFAWRYLRGVSRACGDEEDITVRVFLSVFCQLRSGAYPNLKTRDQLSRLLRTVAANQARTHRAHMSRQKRGQGWRYAGDSALCEDSNQPDDEVATRDSFEYFLACLPSDELRLICLLRSEGYTTAEIAEHTGRSVPHVNRKVSEARQCWQKQMRDGQS